MSFAQSDRNASKAWAINIAMLRATSHALPKFESYRGARNHLNFPTKVSVSDEQFHGIGRLECLLYLPTWQYPRRPAN